MLFLYRKQKRSLMDKVYFVINTSVNCFKDNFYKSMAETAGIELCTVCKYRMLSFKQTNIKHKVHRNRIP